MFDAVDPIGMLIPSDDEARTMECPGCTAAFMPKRLNQSYCSRACQKNASRGNRSAENRERSRRHYERAQRLAEMVYSAPPQERLGIIMHILEFIPHDAGLRNILTDPDLLGQPPRADNRMNIAKTANAYTKKFYGLSIKRYMTTVRSGKEPDGIPQSS
ncbi:hypothetical protein XM53_03625 [Roseovarius atlanticus]|uniref:Uncharacterized protein n=1 Tax=Roseovarius atlanticus TaxID=1641875 RepID=A0A0T5NXN9_9RHOB|nr:hypothetical protein [Roseovarius atlanticus]KRS13687.1 hypothetical protein XM53_03625 [Roseovarius atlanticus]